MAVIIRPARPEDVSAIGALLKESSLPLDGVADRLETTLVSDEAGQVVGTAALELFEDGALLRSVAVTGTRRSSGIGARLIDRLLMRAAEHQVVAVYLLTTTADRYFTRFGFRRIGRDAVPAGVRASVEFSSACPASAVVMRKEL